MMRRELLVLAAAALVSGNGEYEKGAEVVLYANKACRAPDCLPPTVLVH